MNPYFIENTQKRIVTIAENSKKPTERGRTRYRILFREGVSFALLDEIADEYHQLVRDILSKDEYGKKIFREIFRRQT